MRKATSPYDFYPQPQEINAWLDGIMTEAEEIVYNAETIEMTGYAPNFGVRHLQDFKYVRFSPVSMDEFYAYWQPALSGPAPLLIHLPAYSANVSSQPDLVVQGYNILHINPLGYMTPLGPDFSKARDRSWPVLPDTVQSGGKRGYRDWLINSVIALRWAQEQQECLKDRLSFFGTSQGGGTALLLASLYQNKGVRCVAADVPFLTDIPTAIEQGGKAYETVQEVLKGMEEESLGWHGLGLIDTLSHAHRLQLPVLLTAAGNDNSCPPTAIENLFNKLPGTKSYCYLDGQGHGYTKEFGPLSASWFRLYA